MSPISKLRRLRALRPDERRVLMVSAGLLPLAALALRLGGLRRAQAIVDRLFPLNRRGARHAEVDVERFAHLVEAAARHGPYRARCLAVALAARGLLRRRGVATDLCLGVRKAGGRFEAHAWLEHGGRRLAQRGEGGEGFCEVARTVAQKAR